MKESKTFKHVNNKDVAFHVTSLIRTNGTVIAQGLWVNTTTTVKGVITKETIKVAVKDLDKWKELDYWD